MMVEAALLLREELSEAEKDEDYRATLSLERRRSRREEPLLGNLQRIRDKLVRGMASPSYSPIGELSACVSEVA